MMAMPHADLGATLISAFSAFTVTNIDEIVLLALFFSNPRLRPPAVVFGHFLGIAVVVALSVLAGLAAMTVPHTLTRMLGVIPIALGGYEIVRQIRGRHDHDDADDDDDKSAELAQKRSSFTSQTLGVAAVAIANGSDNLSVYIPMFVSKPDTIALCVAVFGVLTAALCLVGFLLAKNPLFGEQISRFGQRALPIVLILLGLDILFT
jgi:cadmium resistance protein CadD (predicted permease)